MEQVDSKKGKEASKTTEKKKIIPFAKGKGDMVSHHF